MRVSSALDCQSWDDRRSLLFQIYLFGGRSFLGAFLLRRVVFIQNIRRYLSSKK